VRVDLRLKVASVGVLHHDAKGVRFLLEEGLLIPSDVLMVDRREDSHFVDGVIFFFASQFR